MTESKPVKKFYVIALRNPGRHPSEEVVLEAGWDTYEEAEAARLRHWKNYPSAYVHDESEAFADVPQDEAGKP